MDVKNEVGKSNDCQNCKIKCDLESDLFRSNWWLNHLGNQSAKLWSLLNEQLETDQVISLLESLGRNCAQQCNWASQYVNDPEGFFDFMNKRSGEEFRYDKEAGIILITTRERDCDCKIINTKKQDKKEMGQYKMPPIYCSCSIGWQKYTYETIVGKKIEVRVLESVLGGSDKCAFEIKILEDDLL